MAELPFYLEADAPESKRAVLESALTLFVQRGLCETTVRDIAAASGYTNPVIFKYFDSKDALARFLYERCYWQLSGDLQSAVSPAATLKENLGALVGRCAEVLDRQLDMFLFVNENVRQFWPQMPAAVRKRSLVRLVRQVFEWGIERGELPASADTLLRVAAVFGFLGQFARMLYFKEFEGGARDWARRLEEVVHRLA